MDQDLDDDFADMIARARAGSRDGIEKILMASIPKIESWNRTWHQFLIRNRLSGRDLTQEVLYVASYSIIGFRGTTRDQWYAWLFRIHRSVVSKLAPSIDTIDGEYGDWGSLDELGSRELTPGTNVSLREETQRVRSVLERLDPVHRVTLIGWLDARLSLVCQAKAMGLSVSKVRTLRLNALREFTLLWKNLRESA